MHVESHILARASHEGRSLLRFTCVSRPQDRSRGRALNMRQARRRDEDVGAGLERVADDALAIVVVVRRVAARRVEHVGDRAGALREDHGAADVLDPLEDLLTGLERFVLFGGEGLGCAQLFIEPAALVFALENPHDERRLASPAIAGGRIPELAGYSVLKREQKYGRNSRIDILLEDPARPPCYVEVKNVTLGLGKGRSAFPDSVTERGVRHLSELADLVRLGHRAVLLFCASRSDTRTVEPADDIDPRYGLALRKAAAEGVEIYAYRARITLRGWANV